MAWMDGHVDALRSGQKFPSIVVFKNQQLDRWFLLAPQQLSHDIAGSRCRHSG